MAPALLGQERRALPSPVHGLRSPSAAALLQGHRQAVLLAWGTGKASGMFW